MLTVWDWTTETIILRSKAFSQDVYLISFHSEMDGILTTSGMGHIKFWKMARTFTGLKLQGAVGKFGLSELSDITSFVHLPDGKVLSGTESGIMLLWEGGAIKCELAIKGEGVCHKGAIDVLMLDDNEVMTGGDDGYVRLWDLESIDCADLSQAPPNCRVYELEPQDEILVSKDAKVGAFAMCSTLPLTRPLHILLRSKLSSAPKALPQSTLFRMPVATYTSSTPKNVPPTKYIASARAESLQSRRVQFCRASPC